MVEGYAAFISYSHQDRGVAAWLQRALEGYRVPAYVVGRPGAFGPVPARLGAVFRDREDLPASADLGASVRAALDASDALIVICSPDAARSRWVEAEIVAFKARAGDARVLALIVAGEPFASGSPGREPEECLPLPLRREVGADGAIGERVVEPMAADLRPEGDGKRLARSKLIAGMLGIPLDMLIRREHARRQRGWAALAAASMLGTVAMGGLALEAVRARDAARARRADAEQLVDFMLGDLRKRLDAVGRLDVLDAVGAETMRYYGRQKLGSLNADELARRARALRMIGELRSMRGDFGPAATAFEQAAATTGELMARNPDNGQRVFDHAQSVFWVGDLALKRGDQATGARSFDEYARLADRLVTLDPANDVWRAEVAYSRSNRGMIAIRARRFDVADNDFSQAASVMAALLARHPGNAEWRSDYADFNGWLADAERDRGNLAKAVDARRRALAIYTALAARDPLDNANLSYLAWTDHALGELAMDRGDLGAALELYASAAQISERLTRIEPNNIDTLDRLVQIEGDLAQALRFAHRDAEADERMMRARGITLRLLAHDPSVPRWRQLGSHIDLIAAEFALARGDRASARLLAAPATEEIERVAASPAPPDQSLFWRARARWLRTRLEGGSQAGWQNVAGVFDPRTTQLRLDETCLLRDAYVNLGRVAEAARLTDALSHAGYAHPGCGQMGRDVPQSAAATGSRLRGGRNAT